MNKAYYGIQEFDPTLPRVYVEMEPGDTVFFHPLLIHGSGANRTDGFRKAISCHYANGDKCHYISVEGTNQQLLADEILDMMKRRLDKFGIPENKLTFQVIELIILKYLILGSLENKITACKQRKKSQFVDNKDRQAYKKFLCR